MVHFLWVKRIFYIVTKYIKNQRQHHQKQDFKNEFIGMLEKHQIGRAHV